MKTKMLTGMLFAAVFATACDKRDTPASTTGGGTAATGATTDTTDPNAATTDQAATSTDPPDSAPKAVTVMAPKTSDSQVSDILAQAFASLWPQV